MTVQLESFFLRLAIGIHAAAFAPGLALAGAPPLAAGEEVVKSKDGCGFVIDKTRPEAKYQREALAKLTWGGACIDGLAMGQGIASPGFAMPGGPVMLPISATAWYGRWFGPSETRWDNGSVQKNFAWEGRSVMYRSLDLAAPVWSKVHPESSLVGDGDVMVMTMLITDPVVHVNDLKNSTSQQHPCPKARVAGCEALWAQHAGPVVERIRKFLAEHEPKTAARMAEIRPLVAAWQAKIGPAGVAKREADARRAASEQLGVQTRQAERDQGCWDKLNKAPTLFDPGLASENNTKRARYLRTLFKGECAGHHYAANALKEADELLARVPELQKQEAVTAAYEKEQAEQRAKDRKETAAMLGNVVGAAVSGRNSAERRQNMVGALGGAGASGPSSGGAGGAGAAGAGLGNPANTPEEKACKAQLDPLQAKFEANQRRLRDDEIVRISELTMWFIKKANAIIDSTCANSKHYADSRAFLASQYIEHERVCNQVAAAPPCIPREHPQ